MPRRKIKIVKRKAKNTTQGSIDLDVDHFGRELTLQEVAALNDFCNIEIKLTPESEKPLEESVQDELELAIEYEMGSVDGFKDWLVLTAAFGWQFIKQNQFSELESQLTATSTTDNETKLSLFISRLAQAQ